MVRLSIVSQLLSVVPVEQQLPPPYSPLFSTVMYVRPDSDRLPQYLKSSGVKFCGYSKNAVTTDSTSPADSMNASPTASTDAFFMAGGNSGGHWNETGFVETWFSGFLMGIVACMLVTTFSKKFNGRRTSRRTRQPAVDA
jgi:hypothetical protein